MTPRPPVDSAVPHGRRPYPPNFIHAVYAWLDRLPIPSWLFFALLIPTVGIAQHLVAWNQGALAQGQFNFDLGTAGYYLGIFLIGIYVLKAAPKALDEYRPLLDVTEEEYARLKYGFVTIPNGLGTLFFLVGLASGAVNGFSDMAVAPAVDYAFPQLRIGIWMIGTGASMLFGYQVVRQLRQMGRFYAMPKQVDLFNLRPLYGFSRYTAAVGIMFFAYIALPTLDPTAYESQLVLATSASAVPLVLLMFYLPLLGVHRRLVSEKERLLQEVASRIKTILERIHLAAFERQDYADVGGMRTVFSTLREEKETLEGLRTWPWRPGTLTGLLSALLVPILLALLRELVLALLGP
ncbi:MAG: hypothetical protein WD906_01510 [Anaerolineales bacterium]